MVLWYLTPLSKIFQFIMAVCKNVTVKHLIGDGKSLGGKNSATT
jgi:hypothetical protein